MLSLDDIKKLIGIEDAEIKNIEAENCKLRIYVEKEREMQTCPLCGCATDKVHDYRTQQVKDIHCFGRAVLLVVRKRRYRCPCGKCFDEKYSFLPRYHRMTRRLVASVISQLSHCVTYSYVARQTGLSVTTVIRIFDIVGYPQPTHLPKTVAIDEFRGNLDGEKYQCILTDVENGKVLDILPSRTGYQLSEYLRVKQRQATEYVVSDLAAGFIQILQGFFPKAKHCADKYHVTRLVVWALKAVRKQVQSDFRKDYRRYFKRSRSLLLRPFDSLNEDEKQQLNIMLYASADLCSAHFLKERFFDLKKADSAQEYRKALTRWIENAESSHLAKFNTCAKTFRTYFNSICNAFDSGYTNGFTEGCNNKIKVLKRISYGLRNFKRARNRILHIFSNK